MTASWSSAATGKPQLSYAERLRRAKEDSTKSAKATSTESTSVIDKQESGSVLRADTPQQKGVADPTSKSQPAQSSTSTKLPIEASNGSAMVSGSGTPSSSSTGKEENPPVANVWEARRKKLLQEKEATADKVHQSATTASVPPTSNGSIPVHPESTASSSSKTTNEKAAVVVTAGSSWAKKPNLVNGNDKAQGAAAASSSAKSPTKSRQDVGQEVTAEAKASLAKAPGTGKKGTKKQSKAAEGATALPPSLVDEQVWPSPENALIARTGSEEGKERAARTTAPSTSTAAGLQSLDVEIIKHAGGEKQRHGKQWISIVPNITHSTPLPSSSGGVPGVGKKKGGKGNVAKQTDSMVASPASTSSTPLPGRRTDQSRSRGPTQRDARAEGGAQGPRTSTTTSPLMPSPHLSSALSLIGSPNVDSRMLSPRLSTSRPGGEQRDSSRSSLSGSRISRNPSPSSMHAVYSSRGTIRGPRFADESSIVPADRSARHSPMAAATPVEQAQDVDKVEGVIASVNNALHLSHPSTSPLPSSSQVARTNSCSELPPATNEALPSTSTMAESTGLQRIRSGAPSPRGHRGRGNSRRKSSEEGESSSSGKTDADMRGLPKDVPSGPRQRNGEPSTSLKSPSMYRNRGSPYGMYSPPPPPHPMMAHGMPPGMYMNLGPAPMPYNQYYQHVMPGLPHAAGAAVLEKTPDEFAPRTLTSSQEPSKGLLHQLEFYFTHRNLEGDFFLRKSMDAQGFVPIQFIASFKKVQQMTGSVEVVRDTLMYSKVLELKGDRTAVRKAIDWHLYTLLEGERPQPHLYQQQQHRPYTGQAMAYASPFGIPTMNHRPPPPMHFTHQSPHPPFGYPPMHMHGGGGSGPHRPAPMASPAVPHFTQQDVRQQKHNQSNGVFHQHQTTAPSAKKDNNDDENDENSGDNDDDEVLGVVAAEGLGGALRM